MSKARRQTMHHWSLVTLGLLVLSAVKAGAEDPYANQTGVTGKLGTGEPRAANATLNPNGVGQVLFGTYYDVRDVAEANGASGPQLVNIQILNTNPLFTLNGGVLARISFRESKRGTPVLSFHVALSCAEVWTATLTKRPGNFPGTQIQSIDPIVISVMAQVVTDNILDPVGGGGAPQPFSKPGDVAARSIQRGFFEVIAEEALPCEPNEAGGFNRNGNTYTRLSGTDATPSNILAGEVFLIRPSTGVSLHYTMPAISRFIAAGSGSIFSGLVDPIPDVTSCRGTMNGPVGGSYTGAPDCLTQVDLALSKNRLMVQYDLASAMQGHAHLVVTQPTKYTHCASGAASPPFSCAPEGELIGRRVYNRLEDTLGSSGPPFPEPPPSRLFHARLARATTIVSIGPINASARADIETDTTPFESGWVDINLVNAPESILSVPDHELTGADPNKTDLLGVGATGFRGLPVLALVLQEYFYGSIGGISGHIAEPASQTDIRFAPQQDEDGDDDGVTGQKDQCPGTALNATVDPGGCSLVQFCSAIDASTSIGKGLCRRSDWKNDEPLMRVPDESDCAVERHGPDPGDAACVGGGS